MKSLNPWLWWRSLPQKKRVRILVGICLALAGIEFWFLAPHIIEMSILVDSLGWAFVLAAVRISFVMWAYQARDAWSTLREYLGKLFGLWSNIVEDLQSWWIDSGFEKSFIVHQAFRSILCRVVLVQALLAVFILTAKCIVRLV